MQFETGSVVQLRSGGPKMTVREHDEKGVLVVWFEPRDAMFGPSGMRMQQIIMPPAMLDLVALPVEDGTCDEVEPICCYDSENDADDLTPDERREIAEAETGTT